MFTTRQRKAEIHAARMHNLSLEREAGLIISLDLAPRYIDGRWHFIFGDEDPIAGTGYTIQEAAADFYKHYTSKTLYTRHEAKNCREKISLSSIHHLIHERTQHIMDAIQNVLDSVKQVVADAAKNAQDAALVAKDTNDVITRVSATLSELADKNKAVLGPEDVTALNDAKSTLDTVSNSLQASNKTLEETAAALEAVDLQPAAVDTSTVNAPSESESDPNAPQSGS